MLPANFGQQIASAIGDALNSFPSITPSSSSAMVPIRAQPTSSATGLRQAIIEAASIVGEASDAAREMAAIANKAARPCEFEGRSSNS